MDPDRVKDRYSAVASRYDRLLSFWARAVFFPIDRYRREAVDTLNLRAGDAVLEIGCGTGLNFGLIEETIGPDGRLIALDYTPAMIAEASKKVRRQGWTNVEFVEGDAAEVASLVTGPVDGVISTACLSIVPGWRRAITGAASLLRPGGRLAILDFLSTKPGGPLRVFSPLVDWWTRHYGFADPEEDFGDRRPWRAVMEEHLSNVIYREMYMGTVFLCHGERE